MLPAVEYARRLIDGIDHLNGHGFLTSLYFANFYSLILIVMYWLALKNWAVFLLCFCPRSTEGNSGLHRTRLLFKFLR